MPPVRDARHEELGKTVGDSIHRQDNSQLTLVESERLEEGDRHGEVLANDVEPGITDENAEENLHAEAFVTLVRFRTCLLRQE